MMRVVTSFCLVIWLLGAGTSAWISIEATAAESEDDESTADDDIAAVCSRQPQVKLIADAI